MYPQTRTSEVEGGGALYHMGLTGRTESLACMAIQLLVSFFYLRRAGDSISCDQAAGILHCLSEIDHVPITDLF